SRGEPDREKLALWLEDVGEESNQVVILYLGDRVAGTNQEFLRQSELVPERLAGDIYRDVALEGRRTLFDRQAFGENPYLVGYRPLLAPDGRILGVIAIPALYRQLEIERENVRTSSAIFSLFFCMIVAMVVLALVIARRIARPLRILSAGTARVAGGDLDFEIPLSSRDEFGDLLESFNRMTRELRASRDRLVRAERDAAWREMARQIAHEIKNPLTPMKLAAQNLPRSYARNPQGFSETLSEGVRMIIKQVDALSRIATEFSNFAKFPSRRLEMVPIGEIVEGALAVFCGPGGDRIGEKVKVVREIQGGGFHVRVDRDEMSRVLVNLVQNGVQAMGESGGTLRVRVGPERFGDRFRRTRYDRLEGEPAGIGADEEVAVVVVADTGAGIDPETMKKVFEPNFSTKGSGTGLGLAICRRSVTELGGLIGLRSRPGEGCEVEVVLRARADEVETQVKPRPDATTETGERPEGAPPRGTGV
ncbi:MAG: HAMP domain-containing protein, partial [Planctomycetes bacterium]|nr:HAMP domain-containing protein [Planctomycetota bacterium]